MKSVKFVLFLSVFLLLLQTYCSAQSAKGTPAAKPESKSNPAKGKIFNAARTFRDDDEIMRAAKGKVKLIRYKDYELSNKKGVAKKKLFRSGEWEFDAFGQLVLLTERNANGGLDYSCSYTYSGRRLMGKCVHEWTQGAKGVSYTYRYYENGRRAEEFVVDSTIGDTSRLQIQYDDKGFTVTKRYTNGRSIQRGIAEMNRADAINARGLEGMKWCFPDTDRLGLKLTEITIDKYDTKHNHVETLSWGPDSVQRKKAKAFYDDRGNNVVSHWFEGNDNEPFTLDSMKWDSRGQCLEMADWTRIAVEQSPGGGVPAKSNTRWQPHSRLTWKYDEQGSKLEQMYYKGSGKPADNISVVHTYEYDAGGNVLKQYNAHLVKGKAVQDFVSEREISYYP